MTINRSALLRATSQRLRRPSRQGQVAILRNLAAVAAFSIAGVVLSIGFALVHSHTFAIVALATQSP